MTATRTRELCIIACTFCRDPEFHRWLEMLCAASLSPGTVASFGEDSAKEFILSLCAIGSRNELDTDPAAAQRFHRLVRLPFLEWKAQQ